MTKETLHSVFLEEVEKLKLRHPVVAIEEKTGYSNGLISEYLSSKKMVSEKFFKAFCNAYGLDIEALTNPVTESSPKQVIPLGRHVPTRLAGDDLKHAFSSWGGLPIYNMPITASFIASYRDERELVPQYYFYDPRFRDCNFGAIITGDSMYPEIRHGDYAALREVTDPEFIVYGEIYYIVSKNGLETCKYVNLPPGATGTDTLLLVPRNEKISPSPIKKDMIDRIYAVRGIIRGY